LTAVLWTDWPGVLSSGRIQLKEQQQYKKAKTKTAKQQEQNKEDKSETV
jgi:hypothetical protein